jgi:predicted alpha/beta-fold hydrolase
MKPYYKRAGFTDRWEYYKASSSYSPILAMALGAFVVLSFVLFGLSVIK